MTARQARSDLLVLGVGNLLREDDGIGPRLVTRLKEAFGAELDALTLYELDIALAPELAAHERLLVIDAVAPDAEAQEPFRLTSLSPSPHVTAPGGFLSHIFDWGMLLALARDLHGRAPQAELLAVSGERFGIGESISPAGRVNADAAFAFLVEYCSRERQQSPS